MERAHCSQPPLVPVTYRSLYLLCKPSELVLQGPWAHSSQEESATSTGLGIVAAQGPRHGGNQRAQRSSTPSKAGPASEPRVCRHLPSQGCWEDHEVGSLVQGWLSLRAIPYCRAEWFVPKWPDQRTRGGRRTSRALRCNPEIWVSGE